MLVLVDVSGVALAASVVASSAAGTPAVALEPRSSMAFKVPLTPVARGGGPRTSHRHRFVLLTPAPRDRARPAACDAAAGRAGRFPEPIERRS